MCGTSEVSEPWAGGYVSRLKLLAVKLISPKMYFPGSSY